MGTTWLTPPSLIEALGPFDLDPCAYAGPLIATARRVVTVEDDGLSIDWHGRVWLNPPYGTGIIEPWLRRMAQHDRGTALIFARTDTSIWHESVWPNARALLFLRGRIKFHYPTGERARSGVAPSVLIAYGDEDVDKLAGSGLDGAMVLNSTCAQTVLAIPRTWCDLIDEVMLTVGPIASVTQVHERVRRHPIARSNKHIRAKVRQVLAMRCERIAPGIFRARTTNHACMEKPRPH